MMWKNNHNACFKQIGSCFNTSLSGPWLSLFLLKLSIIGKDAIKILEYHGKMFQLVPDTFTRKEDHRLLYSTLDLIFKKTRISRFLSESERNCLETNVINLSTIIALRFRNMSITLKMHDVLVHTVIFVRELVSLVPKLIKNKY